MSAFARWQGCIFHLTIGVRSKANITIICLVSKRINPPLGFIVRYGNSEFLKRGSIMSISYSGMSVRLRLIMLASVPLCCPQQAIAADDSQASQVSLDKSQPDKTAPEPDAKALAEAEATRKFGGVQLGAGFSLTLDVGRNDRIGSAELVNDIVRVRDSNNSRARIMLETHYFFTPPHPFLGVSGEQKMWGYGPFVAIQGGDDEIIQSVALGAMIGFRRAKDSTQSFNLGIGVVVDPSATGSCQISPCRRAKRKFATRRCRRPGSCFSSPSASEPRVRPRHAGATARERLGR